MMIYNEYYIRKMLERVTESDAPLNNSFELYNMAVTQTSGTKDYTAVSVVHKSNSNIRMADFDFDFFTKELHFESYCDFGIRNFIILDLADIYGHIYVTDEQLENDIKELEEFLSTANPDDYSDGYIKEQNKELDILKRQLIGPVDVKKY